MVMDSLLSLLIFLLSFSSFNLVSIYASQPSYKDHCASIVPESTPNEHAFNFNSFPLGYHHSGYFTGGDGIIDVGASLNQYSFFLRPMHMFATQVSNLFKIGGTVSFRSTSNTSFYHVGNFSHGGRSGYRSKTRYRRSYATFKFDGFWSQSSGKVCMVGTGHGYSKTGKYLDLDAVFKLDNVFNTSDITSLVNGSLESLSSQNDENHFEPISVLMFPKSNYNYTLDSIEVENEFSSGSDAGKGLALNSLSFCSSPLSSAIRRLQLEFSPECNSSKSCTPIGESSGQLPTLMSLKGTECSFTNNKHRFRFLVRFSNISNYWISQSFNPKTMLVGEGWWDEKKNMLCVVACHIMGKASSLADTHVGDCSIRLRLRFPSIWSINSTSSIVGQIWSNKTTNDPGYFKMITFRNDEDGRVGVQASKYEYSQLDRVKKSCPAHKPVKNQRRRYPEANSYDMRFDMFVRESNKRVAWGYSSLLSVGDEISNLDQNSVSVSISSTLAEAPLPILNSGGLFNISYKILLMYNSTLSDRNSLFNLSSETVRISAEGIYDSGTGNLCMIGCREIHSNNVTLAAYSPDCEILVKFQFSSLDTKGGSYIKGSIESNRKRLDPLYFKGLELSSAGVYTEIIENTVWRMDMEIIMVLISTTLACVFVGLQLYHVKRHPDALPLLSLVMMSILTLGHMIPLILNFEALLAQNPNNKNFVFGNVGWLEVNEIAVRLITMVAFLLQFRLLQLTWSSRKSDESKKGLWVAERKASYVTSTLYAAGLLIAFLLKLKKDGDLAPVITPMYQQHSSWESLKSYGGLVLDGFLLPQIILNLFSNMREDVLSCSFYFGTTFVRLLPHAYDLYRTHNYARLDNSSYFYADPSADFYSTAWDIVIPLGGILFAIIIYLQQRFGAHYVLPHRFKGSKVYEKVPVVAEPEAEVETTNL